MPALRAIALVVLLAAAFPPYDSQKLPYRAAWGAYRVVVERTGQDFPRVRARVLNASRRVLRQINEWDIADVAFHEIAPRGLPELIVTGYSGGAHCCFMDYVFTADDGVKTLLIFAGGNGRISTVQDLDGDGWSELIAHNDVLAYFDGLCYACSPGLTIVIGWDGQKFTDRTRRFPQFARRGAAEERERFLKALSSRDQFAEDERRSAALGYFVNMILLGEGPAARAWLLAQAPESTRRWMVMEEGNLRTALAGTGRKFCTTQQVILEGCS